MSTALRALVLKEWRVLFGSPVAYLVLTMNALVTALVFFEHLRLYNQILFVYASTTMGGFESDTIPDHINLRDTVFFPVMEQLGLLLIIPVPLVTMRVFAEERSRGTDELLASTRLTSGETVAGKFGVTFVFITLMMAVSFIYPVTAVAQGGLGLQHMVAVFLGLLLLALGVASIGLVCSAFTRSQVVAAAATVAISFLFYDFGWTHAFVTEGMAGFLEVISLHPHFGRFSEGLVYLDDIGYFAAIAAIAAMITKLSFDLRRVSG